MHFLPRLRMQPSDWLNLSQIWSAARSQNFSVDSISLLSWQHHHKLSLLPLSVISRQLITPIQPFILHFNVMLVTVGRFVWRSLCVVVAHFCFQLTAVFWNLFIHMRIPARCPPSLWTLNWGLWRLIRSPTVCLCVVHWQLPLPEQCSVNQVNEERYAIEVITQTLSGGLKNKRLSPVLALTSCSPSLEVWEHKSRCSHNELYIVQ